VTFDRTQPGQTVLTNSLGQKTTYRHAIVGGEYRLLEARGAGCASCGETNVRYGYDQLGRLTDTTQLNDQGQPLRGVKMEFDHLGRTVRVSTIAYQNGKPSAPQWRMRYTYQGEQVQPNLVARPSVVPGQEAMVRISYNAVGQLIKVTESGWSPAIDAKDHATPIERTTTYRYSSINGRSLLTQIDGQADSGITRIAYDNRGDYPIEITAQGNRITRIIQRDQAGRPLTFTHNDGATLLQIDSTFAPQGQVQEVRQTAWLLAASTSPQQVQLDEASKQSRKLTAQYDIAGQITFLQLPAFSQDVASRFGLGRPEPAADTATSARIASLAMPDTESVSALQYQTGEAGSVAERDVLQILAQDGDKKNPAPLARRWLDDFKRLIAVYYPDQGLIHATYVGAGNHLDSIIDATGTRTQLRYDAQRQIKLLTRSTADGKLAERIELKHAGPRLIEQTVYRGAHPEQADSRIRTRHNAFGQVTQNHQQVGKYAYAVNHAYDDAGRLHKTCITQYNSGDATNLPSVHIAYHADGKLGNRIEAIQAGDGWFGRRNVISALQWLFPAAPLASSQDASASQSSAAVPPVATAWRYGNGLQAQGDYEAIPNAPIAYRLRRYHDGVHPYAIDSDAGGRIHAVRQGAVTLNVAAGDWHVLAQAYAAVPQSNHLNQTNALLAIPVTSPMGDTGNPDEAAPTDAAGRRLTYRSNQGNLDLIWNSAGQLAQVRQDDKDIATYRYDAQGRRIGKTVGAAPAANRHFIYSGKQLIAEAGGNGEIIKQYLYVGYRPRPCKNAPF
jgi:YD repeat-containing protein